MLCFDVKHKAIPNRANSAHFATGHFHPFRTLPGGLQMFKI